MNRYLLYLIGLSLLALTSFQERKNPKTLLVIVAHPDDESAIGAALVKKAREGNKVIVIIATDGKTGIRVTDIPPGDSLGNLRKLESICSSEKMGIEPPIFLSLNLNIRSTPDIKMSIRNYNKEYVRLLISLRDHITSIKPDAIITFGPDGDSHHSEHILVGSAVTEILLREGWVDKYPLYYLGFHSYPDEGYEMGAVDKQYFNVALDYTDQDELKALMAFTCFKTQFTQAEMQEKAAELIADKENVSYFRRFVVEKGVQNDF